MLFFETSAKANFNVEEAFQYLARVILNKIHNQGVPQLSPDRNQVNLREAGSKGNSRSCCSR